jgi:spermidine synthase
VPPSRSRKQITISHFFHGIGVSLARLTPIAKDGGRFGEVRLFRHPELGKVFLLDDEIQHVEAWAPLYHEPLVHLPASFIKEVKNVVILGGGTLYAASEALKYDSIERVIVIDHNPVVARMAAQHYSHAQRCLRDRRFTLIDGDAYATLPRLGRNWDIVINDGGDLLSIKRPMRSKNRALNLFSVMRAALAPGGVCVDVVYRHLFERKRTIRTVGLLRRCGRVALSLVFLPEYHGILHVLFIWGKAGSTVSQTATRPSNCEQLLWMQQRRRSPCLYYDPAFLRYYFYQPRYLKNALSARRTAA